MAGFQYFIKCEREKTLEVAVAESSLSMFSDRIGMHKYCNLNGGGFMFDVRGKDNGVTVGLRDGQEHIEFDDFTLIYDKEDAPKPDDFEKDDAIKGQFLELGDGNNWMIPTARKVEDGKSNVPCHIVQIRKGEIQHIPFKQYAKVMELADNVWHDLLLGYDEESNEEYLVVHNDEKLLDAFQLIIETNYNLEWFEVSALKLMTVENMTSVLFALVDKETLDNYLFEEKKKA